MSRLTRDGTAEPVSGDQILRHERGQGKILIFPLQLTMSRIDNLNRLIHTLLLYVVTIVTKVAGALGDRHNRSAGVSTSGFNRSA